MADLNWVRLDCNFGSHDKMLRLKAQRDGWRAIVVYLQSVAWSGGHGTDGYIPRHVLPILDATEKIAQTLTEVRLWEYGEDPTTHEGGYLIPNFMEYQELSFIRDIKRKARRDRAIKGACIKNHGPECGCWKERTQEPLGTP